MTHHSGLPSNHLKGMWNDTPEPFENIVEQIKDEYVANPPNHLFAYSNLGVTLLGCALERITGQAYSSYMDASVLSPLGMTHSSFSQGLAHSPLAAKAYRRGVEAEETALRDLPAGGLNTSVLDLSRFIRMVFAGGRADERQIVKPETLAEMLRPQNADVPLDLDISIGLAWMLGDAGIQNGGPVAGHDGATICHRSQLIMLPEYKLGVVVLANSTTSGSVVKKVAREALKLALEAKTGMKQPVKEKKEPPSEVTIPREKLLTYEGRYETLEGVVDVRLESNYLVTEVMNKTLRLVPRADDRFYLQYRLLGLIPFSLGELDNIGITQAMIEVHDILKARVNGRETLVGERMQPLSIPEKWLVRTGPYEIVNRGSDAARLDNLHLRHDNGLLLVDYSLPLFANDTLTFALAPVSDSEAVIYGLGRGKGETIQAIKEGEEELLRYSGYLLRKKPE